MKPQKITARTFLLSLALITGCANPYARFYKSFTNGMPPSSLPNVVPCDDELKIFTSNNFDDDSKGLARQGFMTVGVSDFIGGGRGVTEENVRSQAKALGACRVLVATKYQGTISGAIPWTMPTTSTSYTQGSANAYGSGGYATAYGHATTTTYGTQTVMMPYSQDRYESGALFWVKRKYQLGIQVLPVPAEVTQKIGHNGGLLVNVVVQGTPAYNADILEGDVILTIDDTKVDLQNYGKVITDKLGKEAKFEIYRQDNLITKKVSLLKE